MGEGRRRVGAPSWLWAYVQRRRYYVFLATILLVVVLVLLVLSSSLEDYGKNLSLNLGADLIGTIVVLFIIAPFMGRADKMNESVLERFDHRAFIKQTADARQRIMIMEMWTDLLQGGYQRQFVDAIRDALTQNVEVRLLLLDPHARAAEQRADDLLQQTDVVDNILDNLRTLHDFRRGLPDWMRQKLEIRVYSALPPVQMYRVDDHVIVSFYPVNVTSWNAAQYQTNPQAQLGTFVGTKFDELWEARSTRTLDQFRKLTLEVDQEDVNRPYQVRFVWTRDDRQTYVSGPDITARLLSSGVEGLTVRMLNDNAKGERNHSGPFSLSPLDKHSDGFSTIQEMFHNKYGESHHEVIIRLVPAGRE